ncbi:hypothetical protein SAMN02745823_01007 [Sporobacter termitidis DSM 10068]|uniref:Spermatogenesis-associated protein 20-like TRX domain-containing protein n=1 Tax=Sporobacter termitidis DSM 10068 TaxID=1123282 RepID=A0A1M5VT06_9FIRM|nr:thioredoxin domain-containing protein [Sporobacter termitidis]SHH78320.1 hypothetical protein SAMN02745823_01007 [Sporobacter termitidis DSM 10068]
MTDKRKPNRLIHEKSPYLLQHAYNPVDWYPWGDEAFEKARQEDKPVFLSIGYSTCHWCHVMERESFEDAEVAAYLNGNFVAVKVDREERPDVDAVYMQVCQALTGSGGWPLTVFLTPDKRAFFAGTYFPKTSQRGMNGLLEVLSTVAKLWKTNRKKLLHQGDELLRRLRRAEFRAEELVTAGDFHTAFEAFHRSFDPEYGGFGYAPKFPTPHNLMFLLRYAALERREEALEMVSTTLRQMYRGGLFDHIGYGFSRYSTDEKWLVPHFEKMLYDNALLTIAYLEAYQLTGDEFYRRVVEKTLLYIRREMTDENGAFYSAQDADSEGGEGKYYVLRPETVTAVLGNDDGKYLCDYFSITEAGNFEGGSIPNLLTNPAFGTPDARIDGLIPKIYDYRLERTALFKDTKILTAWNALMIAAYAKAYQALGDEDHRLSAERAAAFLLDRLTRPDGRLYVRCRDGEAAGTGYLEDYAYTAWAFLALYEATFDAAHLKTALNFAEMLCALFEDKEAGGFYLYAADAEALPVRPKETYDGALPSGNSVVAWVLGKLSRLTAEIKWEERAKRQLSFLASSIKEYPAAHCFGLTAAMTALYPSREVVCAAPSDDEVKDIRKALSRVFLPNTSVLVKTKDNEALLDEIAPFAKTYLVMGKKTSFYLCENKTCAMPFTGVDTLIKKLSESHKPANK